MSATFPNGDIGEATGFVIGNRFVVTAAHAVHDPEWGGTATAVSFEPARNGTLTPFGTLAATVWQFPRGYPGKEPPEEDYCLVTLATDLPAEVFRYQLVAMNDGELTKNEFQIAGYLDTRKTAAAGIHGGATPSRDANQAVRVTNEVIRQIDAWKKA